MKMKRIIVFTATFNIEDKEVVESLKKIAERMDGKTSIAKYTV